MTRNSKKILVYWRLLAALVLVSCLSPSPEVPAARTTTPAASPAFAPGEIKIVIWKSHYTLTLYKGDIPIKTYRTVFGKGYRDGDKQTIGDFRTPEGDFYICTLNHSKRFYKFMGLSYPSLKHAEYGLRSRLISPGEYQLIKKAISSHELPPWDTQLGGAIGIHGVTPNANNPARNVLAKNWTDGCIALNNEDIDEIFSVVSLGTQVTILP
jgi:murein L,D-transpeptidase YafK